MPFEEIERREDRNFQNRCKYLLAQIKSLSKKKWSELDNKFRNEIAIDETWDFSQKLVGIYVDLKKKHDDKMEKFPKKKEERKKIKAAKKK